MRAVLLFLVCFCEKINLQIVGVQKVNAVDVNAFSIAKNRIILYSYIDNDYQYHYIICRLE